MSESERLAQALTTIQLHERIAKLDKKIYRLEVYIKGKLREIERLDAKVVELECLLDKAKAEIIKAEGRGFIEGQFSMKTDDWDMD